jgi:hypothetical protein
MLTPTLPLEFPHVLGLNVDVRTRAFGCVIVYVEFFEQPLTSVTVTV